MRSRTSLAALAVLSVAVSIPSGTAQAQAPGLIGAWTPQAYVLADGTRHTVDGRIFFTDVDWTVLFFVTDDREPRRGSAEGGTYTASGRDLVFTHLYHLSVGEAMEGLPESPLRLDLRPPGQGTEEPSTFDIAGDRLTLFFPSGNRMEFLRASAF